MPKVKLTLYIDEDVTKLAHKTAKLSGKSISTMVKDFFLRKERDSHSSNISDSVSKWIGILKTGKTYKQLKDDYIDSRLQKYENTD